LASSRRSPLATSTAVLFVVERREDAGEAGMVRKTPGEERRRAGEGTTAEGGDGNGIGGSSATILVPTEPSHSRSEVETE
jgi:hypothetical protein